MWYAPNAEKSRWTYDAVRLGHAASPQCFAVARLPVVCSSYASRQCSAAALSPWQTFENRKAAPTRPAPDGSSTQVNTTAPLNAQSCVLATPIANLFLSSLYWSSRAPPTALVTPRGVVGGGCPQFDSETQAMQHLASLARLRGTIAARAILGFAALGEVAVSPPPPPLPENPTAYGPAVLRYPRPYTMPSLLPP